MECEILNCFTCSGIEWKNCNIKKQFNCNKDSLFMLCQYVTQGRAWLILISE